MFYPMESLKRGGRFYLCWVADSWPLRFATITHRQLWSQDIRKTCDDLLEVITNESGRPYKRFSLRLSSQLISGLVKVYQRKVTVFLNELCMLNANIFKHTNKKWNIIDAKKVQQAPQLQFNLSEVQAVQAVAENDQRVEELLQVSGNVVTNIQDITLKESAIPDVVLPLNDDFGETHPEQALQLLLQDRTMEMIMVNPDGSAAHSALDMMLDTTDKSHDKSRLAPHGTPQMEPITEHELTLFNKSTGAELIAEFDKDIPEMPEIPPALPVPQPDKPQEVAVLSSEASGTIQNQAPEEFHLEELEENEPPIKNRRLKKKLIVDKQKQLSSSFLRARIGNNSLELRCQDSSDDIITIRVPPESYFRRMCHGGSKISYNNAYAIAHLFVRNLGVIYVKSHAEKETEAAMPHEQRPQTQPTLVRIEEAPEQIVPEINVPLLVPEPQTENVIEQMQVDIHDIPTQKLETLSQQARKRKSEPEDSESPKRQRLAGISHRARQQNKGAPLTGAVDLEMDKENRPDNMPPLKEAPKTLYNILQEAGLADIQPSEGLERNTMSLGIGEAAKKTGSDMCETPLGSLDRTKVSLGESDKTTDSKRFVRDEWGTEGTVIKIMNLINAGQQPVTVENLISKGPVIAGHQRLIAARCFNSILKLKQHGFINVHKDPVTLEIRDITLGQVITNIK